MNGDAVRRGRGDGGSVSLLVVLMVPALLMAAGLVLDGGRQLQARREAHAAAAAAARAAGQLTDDEIGDRTVDLGLAASRAAAVLDAAGVNGSVTVHDGVMTVTASQTVEYLILPGSRSVSSSSSSAPLRGVAEGTEW